MPDNQPPHAAPGPDPEPSAEPPARHSVESCQAESAAQDGAAAVVVVAAGSGTRLGHGIPKALVPLAGRPLLAHALDGVLASGVASRIVVVLPPGDTELARVCAGYADRGVVAVDGGATRNESVRAGLAAVGDGADVVLVHDAARCLTPPAVFREVLAALRAGADAAVPAVPVVDTVKVAAPSARTAIAAETVAATPDRSGLRAVQTPQGFRLAPLRAAHEAAAGWDALRAAAVTDDALLMESRGVDVYLVRGAAESLKITTPLDLLLAEAMVANGYEETT